MIDPLIHWFHLMAAVIWIGGMIFTSFVLQPVLRKALDPETRLPLYHEMGKKFKKIQIACLLILLATGVQKLWTIRTSPNVFGSIFGTILGVKLILVLAVTLLTILHSFIWGPELTALRHEANSAPFRQLVKKLTLWGRVNMALAVAVIFCAVLLRYSPF